MKKSKEVQNHAWKKAIQAQEAQQAQANKHRKDVNLQVGDYVYVSKLGPQRDGPAHRLSSQWMGPFKILRKRGFNYELDLP